MKLEDQVCSLELAIRLKELGVKQDSIFWWHNIESYAQLSYETNIPSRSGDYIISAFTTAELGEMLPAIIEYRYYLTSIKLDQLHHWGTDYKEWAENDSFCFADTEAETEADSRAKMLIWLIENGNINSVHHLESKTNFDEETLGVILRDEV